MNLQSDRMRKDSNYCLQRNKASIGLLNLVSHVQPEKKNFSEGKININIYTYIFLVDKSSLHICNALLHF